MMSTVINTDDANFDHFIEIVSARFCHYKVFASLLSKQDVNTESKVFATLIPVFTILRLPLSVTQKWSKILPLSRALEWFTPFQTNTFQNTY